LIGVLAVGFICGCVVFREGIVFLARLWNASRVAGRFYAEYQYLHRDVAFHPDMKCRLDVYRLPDGDKCPVVIFAHGEA
jgi:hypothetical protein